MSSNRQRRQRRRNQRDRRARRHENPYAAQFERYKLEARSYAEAVEAEAAMMNRFHAEPPSTFLLKTTGRSVVLPKYNGVCWFFPPVRDDQPALEYWIGFLFHVVESMQTLSLFFWPVHLIYEFGVIKTTLGMLATLPLGAFLEDSFGTNKGTAYASLQAVYLTFQLFGHVSTAFGLSYNMAATMGMFIAGAYLIGSALSLLETIVGRTTFAAMISCPQLAFWLKELPWVPARVAFLLFLFVTIRGF